VRRSWVAHLALGHNAPDRLDPGRRLVGLLKNVRQTFTCKTPQGLNCFETAGEDDGNIGAHSLHTGEAVTQYPVLEEDLHQCGVAAPPGAPPEALTTAFRRDKVEGFTVRLLTCRIYHLGASR
jgi:hypothetical protein